MMRSATAAAAQQRDIISLALGDTQAATDLIAGRSGDPLRGPREERQGRRRNGEGRRRPTRSRNTVKNVNFATHPGGGRRDAGEQTRSTDMDRQTQGRAAPRGELAPDGAGIAAADQTVAALLGKLDSTRVQVGDREPRPAQRLRRRVGGQDHRRLQRAHHDGGDG